MYPYYKQIYNIFFCQHHAEPSEVHLSFSSYTFVFAITLTRELFFITQLKFVETTVGYHLPQLPFSLLSQNITPFKIEIVLLKKERKRKIERKKRTKKPRNAIGKHVLGCGTKLPRGPYRNCLIRIAHHSDEQVEKHHDVDDTVRSKHEQAPEARVALDTRELEI